MNQANQGLSRDFVDRLNFLANSLSLEGSKLVKYFPFFFIGSLIALKAASNEIYWKVMAMEDGPAEYLTSLVLLVASGLAALIAIRFVRNRQVGSATWTAIGFALVFFVVAMEEISWGQRVFSVQSPDFFAAHNYQGEITLHNFLSRYPLHMMFILAGLYGAFAWKFFPKKWYENYPGVAQFLVPSRLLQWYFLPTFLLYVYYDYLSVFLVKVLGLDIFQWHHGIHGWIISKDQEPIELLMAIGIMCFMSILMNRQTHNRLLAGLRS